MTARMIGKMKQTDGDRVFKDALVRGTGRCYLMLSTEFARREYRPLVMWACGRCLGYDTQIEGTRALFLYDLIGQYPSPEPFLDIVEERFFASFNKGNWLFQQECELLALFAANGNERSRRILEQGYGRLLQYLRHLNPARVAKPYIPALDSFDSLCKQLVFCAKPAEVRPMIERIVSDVGALCMRDPFWNYTADFVRLSFEFVLGERRLAAMLGRIGPSPEVEAYKAAVIHVKKRYEAGNVSPELLFVLAGNYRQDDDDYLIGAMKKIGSMRHRVHSILARIPEEKNGDRLSRRMLMHLYDTIECTCCRERVVRELGRRRLLTDDMLAECLHDASDNIRDYAKRLMSRRRAKRDLQSC